MNLALREHMSFSATHRAVHFTLGGCIRILPGIVEEARHHLVVPASLKKKKKKRFFLLCGTSWAVSFFPAQSVVVSSSEEDERMTQRDRESQKVHGWTEDYCRYLDYLTTIDISHSATWHQRNRYENTILLGSNDDEQAGRMRARKDF